MRWPINYSNSDDGTFQQHMNYGPSSLYYELLNENNKAKELPRLLEHGGDFSSSFKKILARIALKCSLILYKRLL